MLKMEILPVVVLNLLKREKNSKIHAKEVTNTTMGISKMLVMLKAPIPRAVRKSHKMTGMNGHTKSKGLSTF